MTILVCVFWMLVSAPVGSMASHGLFCEICFECMMRLRICEMERNGKELIMLHLCIVKHIGFLP